MSTLVTIGVVTAAILGLAGAIQIGVKIARWGSDIAATLVDMADLTRTFVATVEDNERRFHRIEDHLMMPPWRDKRRRSGDT